MRTILLLLALALSVSPLAGREIPKPLAGHPGNVFLENEQIVVPAAAAESNWTLENYEGQKLASIRAEQTQLKVGRLPAGFYRLFPSGSTNWISLAVLAPLQAPTPLDSPIALDVAMAWFYPTNKMDAVANLCALAGVNRVRDRLTWAEMETARGVFAGRNRYDASLAAQTAAGLRVLQVIHQSPNWANPVEKRFPLDLRDAFRFYEATARRWRGQLEAFEPWNEADIPMFGGHTGCEMASLQKAAFLGLKSGDPSLTVCWNVFALPNRAQLDDVAQNRAELYFDTFNFHHYVPFERYGKVYDDFRSIAGVKPLWVTECSLPVRWSGDPKREELSEMDLKIQSERVAKTFAASIFEGAAATFYFLLPHYVEGQTQFGLLRQDLTPRPGYVALAAAGRLLAKAKPIGKIDSTSGLQAYCFTAEPDGMRRDVMVAWNEQGGPLELPVAPMALFDHLGRKLDSGRTPPMRAAPTFLVLTEGSARQLPLISPPKNSIAPIAGRPASMVLQLEYVSEKTDLKNSAYRVAAGQTQNLKLRVYNFGREKAAGSWQMDLPKEVSAQLPEPIQIDPFERKSFVWPIHLDERRGVYKVTLRGNFGRAGETMISFRLKSEATASSTE